MLIAITLVVVISGAAAIWLFQKIECQRIHSPDRQYTAIVTHRRVEGFRLRFPDNFWDQAGFIRIEDKNGKNYGKVRIPMLWMSRDLEWNAGGAELKLVCQWDFEKREYRYWNESGTEEFVKHAN